MPIIGVPGCLIKPFSVPLTFPFSVKKNTRILDLDPRTEVYCLSPYPICCKRPPMEEVMLYYPSPDSLIKNRKRVLGVAYL
ncbi:ASN_HP2_G0022030.mRNA.1.CDS.1 [Saccharomyces cerevisiae]|nr:ASN_HP2_G0022030.mRNA.1.CDS.1 [Saccharomyces cerevisiae]CAI6460629.1 ASN_HP2_G0022030.mRNA.1.CDS.1 [Saccharomyces cerevisiae]